MQALLKLIGKESRGVPCRPTRPIPLDDPAQVWSVHDAVSTRDDERPVTLFVFERQRHQGSQANARALLARNGVQRLRTVRHPDILRYLESTEASANAAQTETIQLVTEAVVPLQFVIRADPISLSLETIVWGLFCIARALHFIHQEMKSVHGRLSPATVFVTTGGDWKLGGLEVLTEHSHWQRLRDGRTLQFAHYWPPEMHQSSESLSLPVHALDAWAFGCLMYDLFSHGQYHSTDELRRIEVIPEPLRQLYPQFLAADGSKRAPLSAFFEHETMLQMPFVRLNLALDRLPLTERWEKQTVVQTLLEELDSLPPHFCMGKASPLLQQAIDLGVADAPTVQAVLRIRRRFDTKQGPAEPAFINSVTRWLTCSQIELRAEVIESLDWLVERTDAKLLNSVLFPAMVANLSPSVTVSASHVGAVQGSADNRVRSMTTERPLPTPLRDTILKTISTIAPRLNERNLNQVLMGHFAKLQLDPESTIRTNTTVCLGKIATSLNPTTRRKVLVAAFTRAMRDPFPPARSAGILALQATADLYSKEEMVGRILPALCQGLGDSVADVREQAFRVIEGYLERLRSIHEQEKQREERERVAEIHRPNTTSTAVGSGTRASSSSSPSPGSWQLANIAASLVDVFDGTNTASQAGRAASATSTRSNDQAITVATTEMKAWASGSVSQPPTKQQQPLMDSKSNRLVSEQPRVVNGRPQATHAASMKSNAFAPSEPGSLSASSLARPAAESLWETALAEERMLTANAVISRGLATNTSNQRPDEEPPIAPDSVSAQDNFLTQTKRSSLSEAAASTDWGQLLNTGDARRRRPAKLGAARRPTG
ncbi:hypothetical protein CCYA_CCYA07G2167 [Cyanidiococcus yangmingshanensis]|nr:hypothetical protein CCYA_CCYA07G2167 [Cyanidiococcus yangmingshanensis]